MSLEECINRTFELADNHIYSSRDEDTSKRESDRHLRIAAELYKDLMNILPGSSRAFVGRAVALNDLGRFNEALEHAQEAVESEIDSPIAHIVRGQIYVNLEEYAKAIDDFTRGIALKPGLRDVEYTAINDRGYAYEQMDDLDESIKDFTAAIEFDPKKATAYLSRAYVYTRRGEHSKAYDDLTQAMYFDPNNMLVHAHLGDTMICLGIEMENQGRSDLATDNFKEAKIKYGRTLEFVDGTPPEKRTDKHYFAAIMAVKGLDFMGIEIQTDYAGMALDDGILTADKIKKSTKQVFLE
jgi:tetratricopeptide (TPR) repeat protein|tara:strand:+ start:285 stop:1175 length:891 start_codon:yes stop_codon:yes gene_type:complete